ncbi:MAG: carboxypeptidase-like regulatory domain-containing protein [Planctomycetes bacterium]|jgi:hypothetical protein|nr:carboxypeptidase-like regulatory domain-containing protein [Planctomycetota bacterium]
MKAAPIFALLVTCGLGLPAEPAPEWTRPYALYLPGCEPVDSSGQRQLVAVRLVRPTTQGLVAVAGGTVSFHTEESLGARLLGSAISDEFGFANLPRPAEVEQGSHWHFEGPEGGVDHAFCSFDGLDEPEGELPGGVDRRVRVVGPLAAPLAGAYVEVFLGCPHSPAARSGVTGADGVVVLPNLPPDRDDQFWVVAPGVRPGPYALEALRVGGGCREILTEPGRTMTGVVLDERGAPLRGVVVRRIGHDRGPLARTDDSGRFTLFGLGGAEPLGFFIPGTPFEDRAALLVADFSEDVPVRAVLPRGLPTAPAAGELRYPVDLRTVRRWSARHEDGSEGFTWLGEGGVPVRLTRLSDGFTVSGVTGRGRAYSFGSDTLRLEVPAGAYRIVAGGGFGDCEAVEIRADLPAPDGAPLEIRLGAEQPGVEIDALPEGAGLVAVHLSGMVFEDEGRAPRTPAGAAAAVRVRHERSGFAGEVLLPVPPPQDGRRVVAVPALPANRIRFRVADAGDEGAEPPVAYLDFAEVPLVRLAGGAFEITTALAGRQRLEVGEATVLLDLPVDDPGLVDLGTISGEDRVIRIQTADGTPVTPEECPMVRFSPEPCRGPWELDVEVEEGGTVRVPFAGAPVILQVPTGGPDGPPGLPLFVTLDAGGPAEVLRPDGRITGEVRDPEGRLVPAVVYVDGYRFPAEEGRFDVAGAAAGPHLVIAGARGCQGEVRRILLGAGERRSLVFTLPPR